MEYPTVFDAVGVLVLSYGVAHALDEVSVSAVCFNIGTSIITIGNICLALFN